MNIRNVAYAMTGGALFTGALLLSGAHIDWPAQSRAQTVYTERASVSPPPLADIGGLNKTFVNLAEQLSPTVVNVYTKSEPKMRRPQLPPGFNDELNEFFGAMPFAVPQMKREALGSGFVINADQGYIVTNAHVVKDSDEIMVKFIGEENGKGHAAKVVGSDEVSDVALLKLADKVPGLKAASFGDSSKIHVGEWVLAIGNPYGHTHTVTQGIVSAVGRSLDGMRSEFLQTSASINPGNSGGPLINMNGEVIGINSAIDPRAQNIGFAIPINTAKDVIGQLVNGGKVRRPWLGIGIADISDEAAGLMRLKDKDGVLVREVMNDAPAARAGIEAYDVIRKIDGLEVHSTRDLYRSLDKLPAGKVAEIEVLRGGSTKKIRVQLAERAATS